MDARQVMEDHCVQEITDMNGKLCMKPICMAYLRVRKLQYHVSQYAYVQIHYKSSIPTIKKYYFKEHYVKSNTSVDHVENGRYGNSNISII